MLGEGKLPAPASQEVSAKRVCLNFGPLFSVNCQKLLVLPLQHALYDQL